MTVESTHAVTRTIYNLQLTKLATAQKQKKYTKTAADILCI